MLFSRALAGGALEGGRKAEFARDHLLGVGPHREPYVRLPPLDSLRVVPTDRRPVPGHCLAPTAVSPDAVHEVTLFGGGDVEDDLSTIVSNINALDVHGHSVDTTPRG